MAWRVGIDEAGYGPNLGPLVMSAVVCRVPEEHAQASLWKVLQAAVRKASGRGAAKLPVDDSKKIYSTARGLADLERSVLAILNGSFGNGSFGNGAFSPGSETRVGALPDTQVATDGAASARFFDPGLNGFLGRVCPRHDLASESWYHGGTSLPVAADGDDIIGAGARFADCCSGAGARWLWFRSVIVSPPRFNAMVERWGSKGAVLGLALAELVQELLALPADQADEPIQIVVDKHGGRNHYQPLLQDAIPGGWVLPLVEGMDESTYDVWGLPRLVRFTFLPRGDAGHFEVALASMLSKYLREALMIEFNAFWRQHVPDLTPTAGYPGDSRRFLDAIRPALVRLGIAEEMVWRER